MSDSPAYNSGNSSQIEEYLTENLASALDEMRRLCAQPGQTEQAALRARHFEVQEWLMPDGAIALFAQSALRPGAPTLLLYNHYAGLEPEKPRKLKREKQLVGPGVVAGGTFAARLLALDSWSGFCPVNIKWLIEGSEGRVSPHLADLVQTHARQLRADACLWSSGSYTPDGRAMISLGTKGLLTVELRSRVMTRDSDSALAGVLPNAAWRIAWALNAIKGENEDIRISGFGDENDSDLSIPSEDLSLLLGSARDHKARLTERLKDFGLKAYLMELRDPQVLLTEYFTPTANISGFGAGYYGGNDARTTIPAQAHARLDFRLVPNHDPAKVLELLKSHLVNKEFNDLEIEAVGLALKPAYTSPGQPFAKLAIQAVTETSEVSPLIIPLTPASEPMAFFKESLGNLPIVGLGLAHEAGKLGTRDENIRLADFVAHARAIARLLGQLGQQTASSLNLNHMPD